VEIYPNGKIPLRLESRARQHCGLRHRIPLRYADAIETDSTHGKNATQLRSGSTGHFLIAANQDSDSLVVFRIDPSTGHLTPTEQKEDFPSPTCVLFDPIEIIGSRAIGSSGHFFGD